MADTAVFTLRLPSDLEGMIDICPGDTRTARIIGIIKFAFEQGYPGTEILNQPANHLDLKEFEQLKKLVEYCKWAVDKHETRLDAVEHKLSRRAAI